MNSELFIKVCWTPCSVCGGLPAHKMWISAVCNTTMKYVVEVTKGICKVLKHVVQLLSALVSYCFCCAFSGLVCAGCSTTRSHWSCCWQVDAQETNSHRWEPSIYWHDHLHYVLLPHLMGQIIHSSMRESCSPTSWELSHDTWRNDQIVWLWSFILVRSWVIKMFIKNNSAQEISIVYSVSIHGM